MKTLITNLSAIKHVFLLLLTLVVSERAHGIDAKLTTEIYSWHEDHVAVNIMIASDDHESFVLGNQNIRLFYNADHLTLTEDKIENHLDKKSYSDITISEHESYNEHMTVGKSEYGSVGFLSFNVSLMDDVRGGEEVSASGKHIYTLHFKKTSDFNPSDITLALPGRTEELATAFVEVAEWIDPITSKPMNLTLTSSIVNPVVSNDIHLSVGPNPTSDFIYVLSDETIVNANIYSSNGQRVMSKMLDSNEVKIDMMGLSEGLYIVELEDAQGHIFIRQIAKA